MIKTIAEIAEKLKPLLKGQNSVQVEVRNYGTPDVECVSHGFKTYAEGTEFMRSLGVQNRRKLVYAEGRCVLEGESEGITVRIFINELPPTCRIEKWTEKIPINKTVQTDEFIEVERTKVVCGDQP